MKRYLSCAMLALGAAALLGLAAGRARADGPAAPLPKGPGGDAPAAAAPAAPAAPAVMAPPVAGAPLPAACAPAACAPEACETPLKKVCVGEKATREKTRRVYGESCEDFCVPKCSLFGGLSLFGHKHGDCADGSCGGCADGGCTAEGCTSCERCVRTRKYLVVKVKREEECYNKCHVEYQPDEPKCKTSLFHSTSSACADGACLPPVAGCAGVVTTAPPPATMPPVEKVPAPKEEKK